MRACLLSRGINCRLSISENRGKSLSSQSKLSIIQLTQTFHVSSNHNNTRFKINFLCHNIDNIGAPDEASDGTSNIVVPLPFKDQKSVNSVKREMQNLSAKIGVQIKPVFQSKKTNQVLSPKEIKPPTVNNQCVVYKFQCDLCDTDYDGYTTRHLHQRIGEHKHSAIGSS